MEDIVRENEEMKQKLVCTVCHDKVRCIVFLPCCHLFACERCDYSTSTCMKCNTIVKERLKVIQSVQAE
ncbi:hypothetical protein DPMN_050262 [Dreissena polymorpha]|uniref:RING-type domain-containing protein n=1 Tax=Dreissena polymorpha TaxID=45954 RepID=A0A9D4CHH6_DREPO|nr:hypothetical protein DPMN_050262 [Dreissena polymorpha]